ncbi:BTAD domain-containing putative transcriptional regulator [Streptomyces sp. TG1A-8]|uniref:AfsR/SARP family transcriptional regulator n=1 Tax=Streptomyces sp. TG1A-8 TaxID=3051385 RepID=UPI00265BD2F4|nr:AfsR/SARP family transcriptional regulator [Streptomyces sp. TG1A-8]MDO0925056.1 BTAD domain-containing putative transcriptional regulator [Streptomyces sp. TG1A-8]
MTDWSVSVPGDMMIKFVTFFALLGPVRAWREGRELDLGSPQQRALLALLLLREGRPAGTDAILHALWGEEAPRGARGTVRTYVYRLRAVLGDTASIESAGGGYRLDVHGGAVDLGEFQRLLRQARQAQRDGDHHTAAVCLREALNHWRDQPLSDVRGFFVDDERRRLEELRMVALEELFAAELDRGGRAELAVELAAAISEQPLREGLREQLMLALYRAGRQAEALAVYQEARLILREQLGVDPGPGLRHLHERILSADPTLTASYDFRPVAVPAQLPPDPPVFTGRQMEIAELTAALSDRSRSSAAGITGLGGTGKTALAVHVAHVVGGGFPDGQFFADLGGHDDPVAPVEVLGRFLRALGVVDPPPSLDERAAMWRTLSAGRRMLVVLDDAVDAAQVRPLMPATTGCAVLVTSWRRIVDLPVHWHRLDVLRPEDALHLLAAIAGPERVLNEREASVQLVAACSHQPLSVHVAAARLAARPLWTIGQILAQLEDDLRQPVVMHEDCKIVDKPFRDAQARMDDLHRTAFHLAAVPDCARLSPAAAAALLDLPVERAKAVMETLVDAHVVESGPDGYHYHGLVKAFARRQALHAPGAERCQQALHRLLRHYLSRDPAVSGQDIRAVLNQIAEAPVVSAGLPSAPLPQKPAP